MFATAQISLSAFAFLFGELVQYCQTQVSNISELERRSALNLHTLTKLVTLLSFACQLKLDLRA